MMEDDQKRLLGEFVRTHRESLTPDHPGGRRRTPGLRREELAARAGISATWCAWIEQGRAVQASPEALSRLARALDLNRAERAYLFELAGRRDPHLLASESTSDVPMALTAIVAALSQPAYGLDRFWTACCWNLAASDLFSGWLGENDDHNLLRFIFLDPASRRLIPDWDDRACRVLAEFRADYSHSLHDPEMNDFLEALRSRSTFFADAWRRQLVLDREGGVRSFSHADRGTLQYTQHTFRPAAHPSHLLVTLIPV